MDLRSCQPLAIMTALLTMVAAGARGAEPPRPWPPDQFLPVTVERLAALPAAEQPAWRAYWEASQKLAQTLPARRAPEVSPARPLSGPPVGGRHFRGLRLNADREWYAGDEARTIADRVVERQTRAGAWTKVNDYTP